VLLVNQTLNLLELNLNRRYYCWAFYCD